MSTKCGHDHYDKPYGEKCHDCGVTVCTYSGCPNMRRPYWNRSFSWCNNCWLKDRHESNLC